MPTLMILNLLVGATSIVLPGGPPVGMDCLAYDSANHRVWVPAGNTGNVDVVETGSGKLTAVGGFPTAPSARPGRPNMGPSSATVGDGVIWVGNRANNQICAIDARSLEKRACVQLASMPDCLAYVAPTHELWVTTPRDQTLTIVDVGGKTPGTPVSIKMTGAPEGYAVDGPRGLFFTNLEDKDQTLAIDIKTRKVSATWAPGCGTEGPRGLAVDPTRGLLFVACTDGAVALDLAHEGKIVGRLKTGGGVDNIAYDPGRKTLLLAAGKDAKLTFVRVADSGALTLVQATDTAAGARTVVVDDTGTAYVADSPGGRLLVIKPGAP
jgi:DNA-binding beta-propeller fold protein YncE